MEHVTLPLANFSMTLPAEWGMPLGWSLTLIPILLTIAGLLFHLFGKQLLGSLGIPFKMVSFMILRLEMFVLELIELR